MQPFSNAHEKSKCKLTMPRPEKFTTTNANPTLKSHWLKAKSGLKPLAMVGSRLLHIFKTGPKPQKTPAYIYPLPTSTLLVDLSPGNPKIMCMQLHYD
jgi:hypothetical protein